MKIFDRASLLNENYTAMMNAIPSHRRVVASLAAAEQNTEQQSQEKPDAAKEIVSRICNTIRGVFANVLWHTAQKYGYSHVLQQPNVEKQIVNSVTRSNITATIAKKIREGKVSEDTDAGEILGTYREIIDFAERGGVEDEIIELLSFAESYGPEALAKRISSTERLPKENMHVA